MHELGIVVHITKTLKGIAEENQLKEIASVSGPYPDYPVH